MRVYTLLFLMAVSLLAFGCNNVATQPLGDPAGASRGVSLYPLSNPPPAPEPAPVATPQYQAATPGYVTPYTPILRQSGYAGAPYAASYVSPSYQTTTYQASSYTTAPYVAPTPLGDPVPTVWPEPAASGGYCGPIVIPDPPVIIDNVYYPSSTAAQAVSGGMSYQTTTTYSRTTPTTVTYAAPAPVAAPSPYYSTSTYSAPAAVPGYTTSTSYTTYSTAPAPQLMTTAPIGTTGYPAPSLAPIYGAPELATATYEEVGTLRLVPAPDIPSGIHPNDAGPSQWYEILRPGNGPIRIGRVSSTCVCVGVRVPNRHIQAGERALIEARTLTRPPVRNVTYGIYVNVEEPQKLVLDADVTIP